MTHCQMNSGLVRKANPKCGRDVQTLSYPGLCRLTLATVAAVTIRLVGAQGPAKGRSPRLGASLRRTLCPYDLRAPSTRNAPPAAGSAAVKQTSMV